MLRTRLVTSVLTPAVALVLGACGATRHAEVVNLDALRQPTAEHQTILGGVGTWEGTLTTYMPGMPEQPVAAREVVEAIGGFWTQSHFTCDFGGMAYLGTGCVGYDPARKKIVGTWCDNMSSYLAHMEGAMGPSGKSMVMRYDAPDDTTGVMTPHRIETTFEKDQYTSTFYMGEGAGKKTMVIAMKRTSAAPSGTH